MIESLAACRSKVPGSHIIHQTGQADYDHVLAAVIGKSGISGESTKFIDDMPGTFGRADLLSAVRAPHVGRLTAAGKPAILCLSRPLPRPSRT